MKSMLRSSNRKISLILIALAIGYLILSYQLPPYPFVPVDSDLMPKALGYLLIILSIVLFFSGNNDAEKETKVDSRSASEMFLLLMVTALVILYISLLEIIGFVITTVFFIFICSLVLGYKNYKVNITVSILFPVVLFYIFNYLLQIRLPSGILPI
ncbi:putative tricarboxylic transport membrane protein [Lentibacillus halodurans]|uniref:Putative tricarboxylic transport membrane protein n=2 Tax=Lentibacillus halodurans TaxID=237679 RepID=A0A1I0ZAS3_9BACI|nr:putative tricarboxylic transport membrane protein [Lentibacillus halodurans]